MLTPAIPIKEAKMDRRIGAQFYTLRDYIQNIEDFDTTCKKVAEMGYQIIQISGTPLPAKEMREVIDQYGLKTVVTHRGFPDFVKDVDEIIEYNQILGSEFCGVGSMPFEYTKSQEALEEFIEKANQAAEKIQEAGMTFAYHNHAFEFIKWNGRTIMERLIEGLDAEKVSFIVDTYWLQYGGVNPAAFIRRLGKRAAVLHFKDYAMVPGEFQKQTMAEVGQGNLDWDDIFAACEEAGAKWALVEQDVCAGSPFDSMKLSYDFLKAKGFC